MTNKKIYPHIKISNRNIFGARVYFMILMFAVLGVGVFVNISNAEAATYYVSTNGSDSNLGNESTPFKTIQKCADLVNAGDSCIVRDGTYTDTNGDNVIVQIVNKNGDQNNWITFRADNKWGAVLDGQSNNANFGFQIVKSNYIHIEGFEVKDTYNSALHINNASTYIYYKNNWIHNIAIREATGGQAGVFNNQDTSNITYDGNLIHTTGSHGMYIRGQYTTIMNNILYGAASANTQGYLIQMAGDVPELRCDCSAYSKIINNTIVRTNTSNIGNLLLWGTMHDILIQNNIFYDGIAGAIYNFGGSKTNIEVYNNLTNHSVLVANNGSNDSNFTYDQNKISTDPLFTNKETNNYTLNAESPAIDAELDTNAPAYDYIGTARPQGSSYDIGAYEYKSSTTDTTPPAAPQGVRVE